jgi:hypothetical protein
MSTVWIVHREDRARAALVRLAGSSEAVIGRPSDPIFDAAPTADAVVLGLAGDWEAELEFAHRQRIRLAAAHWVLVGDKDQADAAYAQFDQLAVEFLSYPPRADELARAVRPAAAKRPSLSERARRETAAARFARELADLELPELLRALDPHLAGVPVLVRGEPGTGRGTLLRYLPHFAARATARSRTTVQWRDRGRRDRARPVRTSGVPPAPAEPHGLLEEVGALSARAQRELATLARRGAATRRARADPALARESRRERTRARHPARARARDDRDPAARAARAQRADRADRRQHRRGVGARAPRDAARLQPRSARVPARVPVARQPARARGGGGAVARRDRAHSRSVSTISCSRASRSRRSTRRRSERCCPKTTRRLRRRVHREPPSRPRRGDRPHRSSARPALDAPRSHEPPPRIREDDPGLRRLANALIHQVRNPLATMRTFADLLPERFDDPEFRARFPEMVREDVGRIHGLLARLEQLASLDAPRRDKVDVSEMIGESARERREAFRQRHHLVLKELDSSRPTAIADAAQLRSRSRRCSTRRSRSCPSAATSTSRRAARGRRVERPVGARAAALPRSVGGRRRRARPARELDRAADRELIVRAQGGRLTLGASEAEERVLVVDLPAP